MYCSRCGLGAVVSDGKVIIPCSCGATIIATMSAVTKGVGGAKA